MEPQEKGLDWQSQACASLLPPEWKCLRAALPRLVLLYDFLALLPLLRSRWRLCHLTDADTPCGCRSADLVGVQTNFRLPRHSINAASAAMPHSAGSLPPSKRHSRLTIVRRGCDLSRIAEIHGEAMYTAPDCGKRAQLFEIQTANVRGQGAEPLAFSWGFKGAILSRERMAPFIRTPCAAQGIPSHPYGATI